MGRPKTSEPRDRQLNISLTLTEFEEIRRRAAAVGLRPVHFGRGLLLDPRCLPAADSDEGEAPPARLLHQQLARLGNNLNQLLRQFHRIGREPPPADLEPLLREIRALLDRRAAP